MPFRTFLASGVNIVVDVPSGGSIGPRRLIGAHYDGAELHDNLGGILCLLDLAGLLNRRQTSHRWRLAFWDREERFQQGSRAYLAAAIAAGDPGSIGREHSDKQGGCEIYVDVDAIGLGPYLLARSAATGRHCCSCLPGCSHPVFFLDSDVFASLGIPAFHIFSGPLEFRDVYRTAGLAGCHRLITENGLASLDQWQRAMPPCRRSIMRFAATWQNATFEQALSKAGVLCLTQE